MKTIILIKNIKSYRYLAIFLFLIGSILIASFFIKEDVVLRPRVVDFSGPLEASVELEELRTETSKVYKKADGLYMAEVYVAPIHYQRPENIWEEFDTTIKNVNKKLIVDGLPFEVEILTDSIGYVVSNKTGNEEIKVLLSNADEDIPLKSLNVEGNKAYWSNVWPDTDIEIEITKNKVRLWKILKSKDAKNDFYFTIIKTGSGNLDLVEKIDAFDATGDLVEIQFSDSKISSNVLPNNLKQEVVLRTEKVVYKDNNPANFIYPVWVDADVVHYSGVGDGSIFHTDADWDTVQGAAIGTFASTTDAFVKAGVGLTSDNKYEINRGFFAFNTAFIPDGATIHSADLQVYVTDKSNGDNDDLDYLAVVHTDQPNTTALTSADFNNCGELESEISDLIDIGDITTSAYNTWTLTSAGLNYINITATSPTTTLGLREGHDLVSDQPYAGNANTYNEITFATSKAPGTSQDPKLLITFSVPKDYGTIAFYSDSRPDEWQVPVIDFDQVHVQAPEWNVDAIGIIGDYDPPSNIIKAWKNSHASSVPMFLVPGNHEQEKESHFVETRNHYRTYPNWNLRPFPYNHASTTNYSFEIGNVHLAAVNVHTNSISDNGDKNGSIHESVFKWLKEDLASAKTTHKIVMFHEPMYPEVRHVGDSLDANPANRDKLVNMLVSYGVVSVFVGHTHISKFKEAIWDYHLKKPSVLGGGIWEVDVGCFGRQVGRYDYDKFNTVGYFHANSSAWGDYTIRRVMGDQTWASTTVHTKTHSDLEKQILVNTWTGAGTGTTTNGMFDVKYFVDYTDVVEANPDWSGNNSGKWWEPAFDPVVANWQDGELAIGYDNSSNCIPDNTTGWINHHIDACAGQGDEQVYGIFGRVTFQAISTKNYGKMTLSVDIDDGLMVWLNGTLLYNSTTNLIAAPTTGNGSEYFNKLQTLASHNPRGRHLAAPNYVDINVTEYLGNLENGTNTLAFWNINGGSTGSSDLYAAIRLSIEGRPVPALDQIHYRWRNDDGNEVSATWGSAEDTATSSVGIGKNIRLRAEVSNSGSVSSLDEYVLQYNVGLYGSWKTIPASGSCGVAPFCMNDSSLIEGAATTNVAGGLTDAGSNFVAGLQKETSATTTQIALNFNEFTELEYAFQVTANAEEGSAYYFRLAKVEVGAPVALNSYTVMPKLITHIDNIKSCNIAQVQQNYIAEKYPKAVTSATCTLNSPAHAGNLLVTVASIDKNSGTIIQPTGFKMINSGASTINNTGISGGLAYKVATGGEQEIEWKWDNSRDATIWCAEYSGFTSKPLDAKAENEKFLTTPTASISTGVTDRTAKKAEWALAFVVADSGNSVGYTRTWTNGFMTIFEQPVPEDSGKPFISVASSTLSVIDYIESTVAYITGLDESYAGIATFECKVGEDDEDDQEWIEIWTALNDCADEANKYNDRGSTSTITNFGSNDPPGELITYPEGEPTGVTISWALSGTANEGTGPESKQGGPPVYPPPGTDAAEEFGPVNVAAIVYAAVGHNIVVTLTGVSNERSYTVALFGARGESSYNRIGRYTISEVESGFNNESSVGTTISTVSLPDDSTAYNAGYNWDTGYVVKWTNVVPINNTIKITVTTLSSAGVYLNALKLTQERGELKPKIVQPHYRWRNDDGDEVNATWGSAEDTATSSVSIGKNIRLRIEASNRGTASTSNEYILQYGTDSDPTTGIWFTIPASGSCGAAPFCMNDSSLTEGAATTNVAGGLTDLGSNFVAGLQKEANATTSPIVLDVNHFTEAEYAFQTTFYASESTAYYFRLATVDAGAPKPLDVYWATPQLTTTGLVTTIETISTNKSIYATLAENINVSGDFSANGGSVANSTIDYVIFLDEDGDGVPSEDETYITNNCAGSAKWSSGYYTHRTANFSVSNGHTETDSWSCDDSNFPENGNYALYVKWFDNETVYDIDSSVTFNDCAQLTGTKNWWNNNYKNRRILEFNNQDFDTLVDFPVLIRATSTNFIFQNTLSTGNDLRFLDDDNSTELSYEIVRWDTDKEDGIIWVKVPKITANTQCDFIYLYYNNASAEAGEDATGVWDDNFRAVWHLEENGGPWYDSTKYGKHMITASGTLTSLVTGSAGTGYAVDFPGNAYMHSTVDTLPATTKITAEFLVNIDTDQKQAFLAKSRKTSELHHENEFVIYTTGSAGSGYWGIYVESTKKDDLITFTTGLGFPVVGQWTYHAFTVDTTADNHQMFWGGNHYQTVSKAVSDFDPDLTNFPFALGMEYDRPGEGTYRGDFLDGKIDEVRLSNIVRSADWIGATASTTYLTYVNWGNEATYESNTAPSAPTGLWCEGKENPTNVTNDTPKFSAIYNDDDLEDYAERYCIEVNTQSDFAGTGMWASDSNGCLTGTALSASILAGHRSENITYDGLTLDMDGVKYYWRIWFWDGEDRSATSATGWFQTTIELDSKWKRLLKGGVRFLGGVKFK